MSSEQITEREYCTPKPTMAERPLLNTDLSMSLEATFKDLANNTRLRLLHALIRQPGMCVGDLADAVGVNVTTVSNHLRRLNDRGIVSPQRNGRQVHYRIVDPCIVSILDHGLCLTEELISASESLARPTEMVQRVETHFRDSV